MAYNEERFLATIEINNEKAKAKIKELEKERKKYYDELLQLRKKDSNATAAQIKQAEKNLKNTTNALNEQRKYAKALDNVLTPLAEKTYYELRKEVRTLSQIMRDGTVKKGTKEWEDYAARIKQAKKEMREYTEATREHQSHLGRFVNFLNTNWGAFTQILGSITALSF